MDVNKGEGRGEQLPFRYQCKETAAGFPLRFQSWVFSSHVISYRPLFFQKLAISIGFSCDVMWLKCDNESPFQFSKNIAVLNRQKHHLT